jgi:hypothetical protein
MARRNSALTIRPGPADRPCRQLLESLSRDHLLPPLLGDRTGALIGTLRVGSIKQLRLPQVVRTL